MSTLAIVNGRIVLPHAVVDDRALAIDGDRIVGLVDPATLGPETARVDAGGGLVCPGLVDIHVHGALGRSFDEPDAGAWHAITGALLAAGVTSCLASIVTAPLDAMAAAIRFGTAWIGDAPAGARVLGLHLEGPYLSPVQRGAQPAPWLRAPDDGSATTLLADAGAVRVMTFAPELSGGVVLAATLARAGIVPAVGHSAADETVLAAAAAQGARHLTHLWNGMSVLSKRGAWRVPGLVEAALASDGFTAELIADGAHLPDALLRIALRCFGPDRLCLVSDASPGTGLAPGTRFRMGEIDAEVGDGVATTAGGTGFAGSTTLVPAMVRLLSRRLAVPVEDAVRMASLVPARVVGADAEVGSLEAGKRADVVVFDDGFGARQVIRGGRPVTPG